MTETTQSSNLSKELRKRAEEKIRANAADIQEALSPEEMRHLLHELQVHQVELEMQNEELLQAQEELLQAQEKLKASRQQYVDLYDAAPVGYITLSKEGSILQANVKAASLLGMTKYKLDKKPLHRFILPEDKDIYYFHNRQLFETGTPQVCELRMLRKDAFSFWGRLESAVKQNDDGTSVCRTIISDITERKHAEENLRLFKFVFDRSSMACAISDAAGRLVYINIAHEKLFMRPMEEALKLNYRDYYPPESVRILNQQVVPLIERGETWEGVLDVFDAAGRRFPLWERADSIHDSSGKLLYSFGFMQDITDRKRLEEELVQSKKFETMSTFSAGIAHDFNNLLAGVLNYITLSKDDINKPENAFRFLDEAEKIIFKAKNITDEFLTLSGAAIEYKNTAGPCKLIKGTALLALKDSAIQCEFTLPEDTGELKIAPALLRQIISSVVENSLEAMPNGGLLKIKAEHSTRKEEESNLPLKGGMYLCICISDNGCGISKENLSRIFDPYYSTKQRGVQKGMGLGLAVVYSIVTRLNGYIHIESKKGVGTEVFIYLPSTGWPAARDEKQQEAKLPEIKAEAVAAAGTKRILFMDDEKALRTTIKIILGNAGYNVDVAESGEEAIKIYIQALESGSPFDAAILDLTIVGGMGGVETIKNLLEINPDIKAIVSSGYSNDPVLSNYESYGFKGSLPKPARKEQIIEELKKLC